MHRKLCSDCGSVSLESESRCWACGGTYFVPAGDPLVADYTADRTLALGMASDRTMSWPAGRPSFSVRTIPPALIYVGGAFCFALFMCVLGYWVGKASTPDLASAGPTELASAAAPMPLPSPPTGLQMATAPNPAFAPYGDSPVVTVQTRQGQLSGTPATPPAFVTPVTASPAAGVAFPGHQPLPADAGAVTRVPSSGSSFFGGPAPGPLPSIPAPGKDTAVVTLRNDTPVAVQVTIDGEEGRIATVAPGAILPLILPPGTYRLKASGGGISSVQSSLALAAERSYTLIVNRKQDGGKDTLVLIEPILDAISG